MLLVLPAANRARAEDAVVVASVVPAAVVPSAATSPAAPQPPATPSTPALMPPPVVAPPSARIETFSIVLGGDLGLGGSDQPVSAEGALRHGRRMSVATFAGGLAPLLKGDVVFANLETVVTDRNDLRATDKTFTFRSHPAGVQHLVEMGFNALSLANNHAIDYGEAGLRETVAHLSTIAARRPLAFAGVGLGRDAALAPAAIDVRGVRVRLSALGIGAGGFSSRGDSRPVMAAWGREEDVREVATRLADAPADLRILSVHYGLEMQVRPSSEDERRLRSLAQQHGLDIVAGHHAHVAAGVQEIDGRVIFFGLGNLAHPGMQDMDRHGLCRDYGLLARVHFMREAGGRFTLAAIEATALREMHAGVDARTGDDGRQRVAVLNHLAQGLDDATSGARGVRFLPRADGTGLHCRPGAERIDGPIGAACRAASAVPPTEPSLERRVAASCGSGVAQRRDPAVGLVRALGRDPAASARARIAAGWPSSTASVVFLSDR